MEDAVSHLLGEDAMEVLNLAQKRVDLSISRVQAQADTEENQ